MSVKIKYGGKPHRSNYGLSFTFPEVRTWDDVKREAFNQLLRELKMKDELPDDAQVSDIFPIEIEMDCCGKCIVIKDYEHYPSETMHCCEYGAFIEINRIPIPVQTPTRDSKDGNEAMERAKGMKCPVCHRNMMGKAIDGRIVAVCEGCKTILPV